MQVLRLTLLSAILSSLYSEGATVFDSITGNTIGGNNAEITGPNSSILVFTFLVPKPDEEVAVQFQTGAFPSTFDQLDFAINSFLPTSTDPIEVSLSSGPTAPGGVNPISLGSVTPSGGGGTQVLTVAPSVPVPLAANTSYWLHFTTSGSDPIYTLGSIVGTNTSGSWSVTDVSILEPSVNPAWVTQPGLIPALRIEATESIPEPSTTLLGALGAIFALCTRRRLSC